MNRAEVLEALESGPYAWPGGYPRYFITPDGEALSSQAVEANRDLVLAACAVTGWDDWKVSACEIYWEGPPMTCAQTGAQIKSAYGDPDEPEESE
jgi:hypothetical protein